MPPPILGSGKTSRLRMLLALQAGPERAALIAGIVETYRRTTDIGRTAAALNLGRRSLERLIEEHADLALAISHARAAMGRPC